MTDHEIITGNKSIAEFMGWECSIRKSYEDGIKVLYKPDGRIFRYAGLGYLRNKNPWDAPLKFHQSWDWLMPVVEKITVIWERHNSSMNLARNEYWEVLYHTPIMWADISSLYKEVIEFIKWYNQQKDK